MRSQFFRVRDVSCGMFVWCAFPVAFRLKFHKCRHYDSRPLRNKHAEKSGLVTRMLVHRKSEGLVVEVITHGRHGTPRCNFRSEVHVQRMLQLDEIM